VFDLKWCWQKINEKTILGSACEDGSLQLYSLLEDDILSPLCTGMVSSSRRLSLAYCLCLLSVSALPSSSPHRTTPSQAPSSATSLDWSNRKGGEADIVTSHSDGTVGSSLFFPYALSFVLIPSSRVFRGRYSSLTTCSLFLLSIRLV
jgi:hypothetical protein